jgi:hypothetical protein
MAAMLTPIPTQKEITDLLGQLNSQTPNSPSHPAMNPVTITQDQLSSIVHALQTTKPP